MKKKKQREGNGEEGGEMEENGVGVEEENNMK